MNSEWNDPAANQLPETVEQLEAQDAIIKKPGQTRVVVVGLGMVSIAFIEKLLKADVQRRQYDIVAIGEEPVLAYNRVGLTSFFQHREVENLYLQPETWYSSMPEGALTYRIGELVKSIDITKKTVLTSKDATISYDILVIATGSDATLPRHTPNHGANGVFVYRTLQDLQNLITFAATKKGRTGMVVGGGLLGLEAAKAMMDLEDFGKVKLIERNRWVLSRQLDGEAGSMVVKQVQDLGLDVLLSKRVGKINTDDENNVISVTFEDGETTECSCICFAIGIKARDEIARKAGITCADRGGGIVVDSNLRTSVEDVYAIGECSSFEGATAGLIAPGVEQAAVLAHNLTTKDSKYKTYKQPDLSVKLKLLGVEVASFGDFFADRDGPKSLPITGGERRGAKTDSAQDLTQGAPAAPVKALVYKDPFTNVYKKYIFTEDGKYLLGGMMIGDTSSYIKLVQMTIKGEPLKIPPGELIVGSNKGDDDGGDLADDTQICSCHNVTKGQIVESIKSKECSSVGDLKSVLKVGAGCGGCTPLAESLLKKTMKDLGADVKDNLCVHFDYNRQDLYNIISVKQLQTFEDIMKTCGRRPDSIGCEVCKPALTSILSSLFNKSIMSKDRHGMSDTNDAFLANRQRDGTFSVLPRTLGGQITPHQMITVGEVARDFNLSLKIATGQRPDMFGARKHDLPAIWKRLVDVGMTSGHAYAKSVRTVKSCVGSSWCRFGVEDSTGMAIRLETLLSSIRFPHKVKLGISGCARECAEAQSKDIGLIAAAQGAWNIYVGGNGGAKPRHAELLAKSVATEDVVPIIYRYLAFYQRTADKLQRTARWQEQLPGGIEYLRQVLLEDSLGLCKELEAHMESLVNKYVCEWTETLKDPEKLKLFKEFANTDETTVGIEKVVDDLGQKRPAYWLKDTAGKMGGQKWTDLTWEPLVQVDQLAPTLSGSSVAVKRGDTQLAIYRVKDKFYSTQQMCPHRRAFVLSDGLIADDGQTGKLHISCPMHKRNYELTGGKCTNDESVDINTFEAEARDDGMVYVKLPPVEELDSVLGTSKWKIQADERTPFAAFDKKYKKGVKVQAPAENALTNGHARAIAVGGERGSGGIDW